MLRCVFEKIVKVSINKLGVNPLYCVSPPGYTWQRGLKYSDIILQALQDQDMILIIEHIITGGKSSVMGNKYVKLEDHKKIFNVDADSLCGWAMSQSLPYDEITMKKVLI